jgi:uncharacterized membrane-anchored protein
VQKLCRPCPGSPGVTYAADMEAGELPRVQATATARNALIKVPEITALFWITKILTTGMGEATSDFLVEKLGGVPAVGIGLALFVVTMALQFAFRRYNTWVYWLAVVGVSVFGTQAADVLHVRFHIPYTVSSSFYAIVLIVIFTAWYRTEGTLSIHSISTRRREVYYWLTVLATFALGTAVGDLTATTFGLGYLGAGVMFAILFLVPAVAHWLLRLNAIVAFWIAYVLTRPLGASFADYLGVGHDHGGVGLGRGLVSLGSTILILGCVCCMAITRSDVKGRQLKSGAHARAS